MNDEVATEDCRICGEPLEDRDENMDVCDSCESEAWDIHDQQDGAEDY